MASNQLSTVLQRLRQIVSTEAVAETTDGQLLQRFSSQRDEGAFAALLARHGPMVLGVCRRALGNSPDAEDAFQATFLVLVHKAASLRNQELVSNWLYGVACRIARRARTNAARRRHSHEVPDMALAQPQTEGVDPELRPLLDEEVQRLPRRYRTPIVLCYLEGLTNEAVARQLRWPTGTVKTRLAKARDLLRERLERRGLALSAGALMTALTSDAMAAVPPALADATCKATLLAAGQATGTVSASIAALVEGALRELFLSRLVGMASAVLALTLLGGAGLLAYHAQGREEPLAIARPAEAPSDDGGLAVRVSRRVDEWQPAKHERRFDEIGWVRSLQAARTLSQKHGRPIFLAVTGGRIETGRATASATNMRASAFSHDRVIELLNARFIPVYLSSQDYAANGSASAEEKAELARIRQHGEQGADRHNLAWVIGGDGQVLAALEGCYAAMANRMITFLEEQVFDLPGQPVIAPVSQARPPQASADALVLHLTARYLERKDEGLVPLPVTLGRSENYYSRGCPGENWLVLNRNQWSKLLPAKAPRIGDSWDIDAETAALLFRPMYPPSEDNNLAANRIDEGTLTATVVTFQNGVVRTRLDGRLVMKHRFDPEKDDQRFVNATLLGFIDFDLNRTVVPTVQLMTTKATYGKYDFGVVVRSIR